MMTTYEKHNPINDKMNGEGKKIEWRRKKRIIRERKGKKGKNRRRARQEMLAEKIRRGGGERKRGDWES